MANFGLFRGFSEKLFEGEVPSNLGTIGIVILGNLLDDFPNSAAAYSLRKLRTAYTGSAIRVRRSSDNAEQDIGFTSTGTLDTTALLAFTGTGSSNNGFVATWYDQSGNSRNATQTTAANQSQIVSSGIVILENNKPTLQFNGLGGYQILNRPLTGASAFSVFSTVNLKTAQSDEMVFTQSDGSANNGRLEIRRNSLNNNLQYLGNDNVSSSMLGTIAINNKQILSSYIGYSNIATAHINNVLDKTSTNTQINIGNFESTIGERRTFVGVQFPLNGAFQELVIYSSDQSSNRTGIETNINDFYSIY
jgi:hypothetical protein